MQHLLHMIYGHYYD